MSDHLGFAVVPSQIGGGLARSALPDAPVVAEPDVSSSWDEVRLLARQLASAALLRVAVGSTWLARRIDPPSAA
jgi:hypothetical protein